MAMNKLKIYWNTVLTLEAECTGVMAYQICEMLIQGDFVGETQKTGLRKLAECGIIDAASRGELIPETVLIVADETGRALITIN